MDYYWDKGRQTLSNVFSSPPPVPPTVQYHGLLNQGATCYLNSVLQVLFKTEDFREAVERHCFENPATKCIDQQLKDLFDDLKGNTAYTYNITKKLGINRVNEQQDAAEYYEKILNLTSPDASQIFHGWLTDRTTCFACGTETDTDGAFWHLPLALVDSYREHYSVVGGIKEHFRASEFSRENQMYCEECDAKCDATIQCVMKHHPEVLMLLLKRFDFDYRYMTYVKINQTVDVPRILQIPENQTYELYAVVDHSGDLRSGHYSATIWDDENWFTFNDSRVTLADYQPFQVDNFEKSRSAYLLFYRKKNATGVIYDQGQDLGKKRGREEGEAIDRYEEKESNEERNDLSYHLQDTQAEEHRDEVGILTCNEEDMGGNAEAENQAEKMEPLNRVTQREESVDNQSSGKESAQDVSDDLKPEFSDMLAKDAHLREEFEMSVEERGEIEVKTGEDKQSEKEEQSLMNYPEDNLRGTRDVGQVYDLKPVSEDELTEERGGRTDDEEGKTEAGVRGMASEIGKLNHDYGRDGGSKQSRLKDNQHREKKMDVHEVEEQERGNDKHAQSKDTSVTERYPTEGVQAQDSDGVRQDDASVHSEQKIQKDVELDKKGKKEVHERRVGSGPTKLRKISDLCPSNENRDYRRDDDNKQKMPKDDQRCKGGGSSRRKGHEQERGVRRDVEGVKEQKRGDSAHPHVGLDDSQRMSEQRISGTYTNHKDGSAETQSKHIPNRSDSSLRRAGSAGSRKPTECQEAGCGEKVRQINPKLEFPDSVGKERPGLKDTEIKTPDKEIDSETVAGTSAEGSLPKKFAKLKVSESPPTKPKTHTSKKAVRNAQEEETNKTNKRKHSDTSWWCGPSFRTKKKRREREEKQKTTTGCLPFGRQQNVDSD